MLVQITFSMTTASSAPVRVGSVLVPHAAAFTPRWFERGDRTYVTMDVRPAMADRLERRLVAVHPTVRCIDRHEAPIETAV